MCASKKLESNERNAERAKLRDERHDLIDDARNAHAGWTQQDCQYLRPREPREHRERLDATQRYDGLERAK